MNNPLSKWLIDQIIHHLKDERISYSEHYLISLHEFPFQDMERLGSAIGQDVILSFSKRSNPTFPQMTWLVQARLMSPT